MWSWEIRGEGGHELGPVGVTNDRDTAANYITDELKERPEGWSGHLARVKLDPSDGRRYLYGPTSVARKPYGVDGIAWF